MVECTIEIPAGILSFEYVHVDFITGQRSKCQGGDELRSAFGHQHSNIDATVLQPSNDLGRFVACNAAADAKRYLHIEDLFLLRFFFLIAFTVWNAELHKSL